MSEYEETDSLTLGAKPTENLPELKDGLAYACYAYENRISPERLDWLSRWGTPETISREEIRILAQELWQRLGHDSMMKFMREVELEEALERADLP
jgi:hypothetical protein